MFIINIIIDIAFKTIISYYALISLKASLFRKSFNTDQEKEYMPNYVLCFYLPGLFPAIFEKGPWPKLGKMIDLTPKLGEMNDIEHNKGSKKYPQIQVLLDFIMPSIPLKHKYSSIILIWVIVSHK